MADLSTITLPNGNTYNLKDATARSNSGVTGVKGNAESSYRTGNVNLTADQVGAITKGQYGNTQFLVRPLRLNGLNDNTLDGKINTLRANRLAFLPADQIIIEKTTDGGTTWTDAGISDGNKVALFSETRPGSIIIPLLNGVKSLLCGLRITFTAMKYDVPAGTAETQKYNYWNSNYVLSTERYNQLKEMYFWISANSDTIGIKLQRATGKNSTSWNTAFEDVSWGATGWSGCDYIRFEQNLFGGGTNQTTQYWNYRLTFMTRGVNGTDTLATSYTTSAQFIQEIRGYGDTWWTKGNEYAANDKMYTHDFAKNVTFPAGVNATSFNGYTIASNVPANAKFTDTTYSASTISIGSASTGTAISADDITAWTTNTPTVVSPATVVTGGSTASITPVSSKTVVTGGSTTEYKPVSTISTSSGTAASASVSNGVLTITNGSTPITSVTASTTSIKPYTSLSTGTSVTEGTAVTVYKSLTTGPAATVTAGTAASLSYTSRSIPNISVTSKNVVSSITTN